MVNEPFELHEDASGRLILRQAGRADIEDVRIRRSFPWTAPRRLISVRAADGAELLLIDDLDALDPSLRRTVETWLDRHSFIPRITRIDHVNVNFGYQQWRVQTDRGEAQFRVQEREDIRFLPDGRFSIRDADGTVYELAPLHTLDPHSRRALEPLL